MRSITSIKAWKTKTLAAAVISVSSGVVAPSAMAQSVALEEVVVTAERREASLQDTPISVISMSAEAIEQVGVSSLNELASFMPNVNIVGNSAYGRANPEFNIRGVGAGVVTSGVVTERPVGLYIDGLYFPRSQGALLSLIDAERIDVLRGPQGTLFGRNNTGGAIAYTSKKPTGEFGGSIKAKVGEFNQRFLQGMLNVPLSDTAALRVTAMSEQQDGYVSRGNIDLGNVDDQAVRAQLNISPSEDLTIDLAVSHSETATNGDARDIYEFDLAGVAPGNQFGALDFLLQQYGQPGLTQNDPRIVLDDYSVPSFCMFDDPNPLTFGADCETNLDGEMDVFSSQIVWRLSDTLTLTSITGYLSGDQTAASSWVWSGGYYRPVSISFESYSQEFQFNWDTERLNFVGGIVYFHESSDETEFTDEIKVGGSGLTEAEMLAGERIHRRDEDYHSTVDSYGIFAQGTYALTDKLNVTAGIRYSTDEKEVTINYNPTADDPRDETGYGSEDWSDTDWRLAVDYRINDNVMVYASATDAYKAGIADDSSIENRSNTDNVILFIPPEAALGYELGLRSEWFDNRLRFNFTVYQTEYTDRQSTELQFTAGIPTIVSVNLGDVDFDGYEAEVALAVSENLTINGSLGVSDYEQLEAPDQVLANVPERSWTLGVNHALPLANGAALDSSLTYGWTDEAYASNGVAVQPRQALNPDYGLLSGRLEYTAANDKWSLALYGTNLLDEEFSYSASAQNYQAGFGSRSIRSRYMGRPRSLGLELQVRF